MIMFWQEKLRVLYGLDARLTRLAGEFDLNFAVQTPDGREYVFKVMRPDCDPALVEMQCHAYAHIRHRAPDIPVPIVQPSLAGAVYSQTEGQAGEPRLVWLMQRMPGMEYADFRPHSFTLIRNLGKLLARLDLALQGFHHPALLRELKWDLLQGGWIKPHIGVIEGASRRAIVKEITAEFDEVFSRLQDLPHVTIHNDINDHNILIQPSLTRTASISGLIDLGDIASAPRVCEIAIAGAYIVLDHVDPEEALAALVQGYHRVDPLSPVEVDLVYPLLRMRLATSVVNSTLVALKQPDDPYVVITQAPAWRFLELKNIHPKLLQARLRCACGLPVTDAAPRIRAFLQKQRGRFAAILGEDLAEAPMGALSVAASTTPQNPFDLAPQEAAIVGSEFENKGRVWLGYYSEPRLIYTAKAFRLGRFKASDRRSIHVAVDAFAKAGRVIYAPLAGRVVVVENRDTHLDYGGVVILAHETPEGDGFYTLYGHLNPEVLQTLSIGQKLAKGEAFCRLGDASQNGGWSPHVHFQLALTTEGLGEDWPGVADPDALYLWQEICPNPAALLNLSDEKTAYQPLDGAEILAGRTLHFGENVKLSYNKPAMFLRGWRHHLFDEMGRPYLDAYNNVPHVGHAHPRIQAVAADQLKRMNSNTRYLHPAQVAFAEKITAKMPEGLSVCYMVNSGSEANELALRLARARSGGMDMITPDHGYHGNTTGAMAVSAYKFRQKGGDGQDDWVHLVDVADDYQGRFRRSDPERGEKFAAQLDDRIAAIQAKGRQLAGFISEVFPSVGGQFIPPDGYLEAVYQKVRAAGGICIADEVQTGLGRLGSHYYGFEQQGVTPDIVVLGKPIGNGHPLGVVVTTPEIAASFSKGPEYFSTFGGSTLSCRIGSEVLDIIDQEVLQQNALKMGGRLLEGLYHLQDKHVVIGDVRGLGLFIGVELVTDRASQTPAADITDYVINRMCEKRVLIGSDGIHANILKIRPPLTIEADDIDMILLALDEILSEISWAIGRE